jgi:phosphosulfolactate synthase
MLIKELDLANVPARGERPREVGLTLALDKGLSPGQAEDFMEVAAQFVDFVKLGWGTSMLTPSLDKKLDVYRSARVPVFLGGTLFEFFLVRDAIDEYRRLLDRLRIDVVEISDGAVDVPSEIKLAHIESFAQDRLVLSEVGSKDAKIIIPPYRWVEAIREELAAGSWKVICEARESGTAGLFRPNGEVRSGLVDEITELLGTHDVIFEAPNKEQQVWFIRHLGHEVNLGNIRPEDVIPLETLRLGLRGDTFHQHLSERADERARIARQDH